MSKILQDVNVGMGLSKARLKVGLTQEAACAKMATHGRPMSQSHLANIEQGRRNIFVSDMIVLSRIYKTTISEFFEGLDPISRDTKDTGPKE